MEQQPDVKGRHRNWVFTIFKYEGYESWKVCLPKGVKYLIFQLELTPTTKRLHWQGYLQLTTSRTLAWLKKHLHPTARFAPEYENSSPEKNQLYCSKKETYVEGPWELGEVSCKGVKRKKATEEFVDLVKSGATDRELIEAYPSIYLQSHNAVKKIRTAYAEPSKEVRVIVHWGVPGAGKTYSVYDKHGQENVFSLTQEDHTVWFDGYDGQEVLLIDDFYGWIKFSQLLKYIDQYPVQFPIKGGKVWRQCKYIYFTSNVHPDQWYSYDEHKQYAALDRRIHEIKHFAQKYS